MSKSESSVPTPRTPSCEIHGEKQWCECWQCGGEGVNGHDCGEDCCVCLDPEENVRCDICRGKGGWWRCYTCTPMTPTRRCMADSMDKTGHVHTCMSCGKTWRCPSPAVCGANAKVLPSIVLDGPDGPQVFDHVCRRKPASKSEIDTRDAERYRAMRRFEVSKQNAVHGEASTDESAFDAETDLLISSEELQQRAIKLAKERARG